MQVLAVVIGHVVAAVSAHDRALHLHPGRRTIRVRPASARRTPPQDHQIAGHLDDGSSPDPISATDAATTPAAMAITASFPAERTVSSPLRGLDGDRCPSLTVRDVEPVVAPSEPYES